MTFKPIVRALIVPVLGLSLSGRKDQPNLFDEPFSKESPCGTEEEARKLRRNTHPATSDQAAHFIVKRLGQLHATVIVLVQQHPGKTANELAKIGTHRDTRHVGRRLPELVTLGQLRRGDPRKCSVTGRMATTWWPT